MMPTPAVDQSYYASQALSTSTYYPGGNAYSYTLGNSYRRFKRPASVSNPRRADRTRAPGSWSVIASSGWDFKGTIQYRYRSSQNRIVTTGLVLSRSQLQGGDRPNLEDALSLLSNVSNKALASGTSAQKQLNAALAQANSTASLVGRMSSGMARGLDNLMGGKNGLKNLYGTMSQWRKIPSKYLEYLYGWRPLSGDVANAFEKLAELKDHGFQYSMILKAAGRRTMSVTRNTSTIVNDGAWADAQIHGTMLSFARCAYRFDLPQWYMDQDVPVLAPFSTAYELARLSFVLDWFLPIGDWVGAMESAQWSPFFKEGWELYGARESYTTATIPSYVSPTTYGVDFGTASGEFNTFEMVRRALTSAPVFSHMPALNPLPGIQQAAQGLSLLTQAFQRWR